VPSLLSLLGPGLSQPHYRQSASQNGVSYVSVTSHGKISPRVENARVAPTSDLPGVRGTTSRSGIYSFIPHRNIIIYIIVFLSHLQSQFVPVPILIHTKLNYLLHSPVKVTNSYPISQDEVLPFPRSHHQLSFCRSWILLQQPHNFRHISN